MTLEVEIKVRLECREIPKLVDKLKSAGASVGEPIEEVDRYFAHPCRDFAVTDEALRLRISPGKAVLTYKGPRVPAGDLKARFEAEIEVKGDIRGLLEGLGFREIAVIRKKRIYADLEGYSVSLDEVDGLGCFMEVESRGGEDPVGLARRILGREDVKVERLTYLEMLLSSQSISGRWNSVI